MPGGPAKADWTRTRFRRVLGPIRRLTTATATALIIAGAAGCVSVPPEPRIVVEEANHAVQAEHADCATALRTVKAAAHGRAALDPHGIRVFTWNIHKQADAGWRADLEGFAQESDLVLLQESVLDDALHDLLDGIGLRWGMASSFVSKTHDIGVLTASRVPPLAMCTLRVTEPLLRLPKSSIIAWFDIAGSEQRLAVANMHSINFSLSLGAYRRQLGDLVQVLAHHDGPIIFAGDLNTWTEGRYAAVREATRALGLTEVHFARDRRKMFWGKQLDHIFVRGLAVSDADALPLETSDHYPVQAMVELVPGSRASSAPAK